MKKEGYLVLLFILNRSKKGIAIHRKVIALYIAEQSAEYIVTMVLASEKAI